ncbi:hypothetical protein WMY93_006426 [Mugilogobius chulae]|uniref:Uncharacterized protein n=1 Tax=Mugilogobius chulae TaxID=88201 RepID=A0AAW0PNQ2_9GOBI
MSFYMPSAAQVWGVLNLPPCSGWNRLMPLEPAGLSSLVIASQHLSNGVVHPPCCLSPALPNRLRQGGPMRVPTRLQRKGCTCSLPVLCPYRLDCPYQAGGLAGGLCVLLACSLRPLCQTADWQIKQTQAEQQGGEETHHLTGSRGKG